MFAGRFADIDGVLATHVERGELPGLATLLAVHDEVHVTVLGTKSFDDAESLERDAIFRIASLTKPIAATATMALVDDGVAANRPITIDDLLTFRLGLGCVLGRSPWQTPRSACRPTPTTVS
jgi:CubicO group peptidase (beta-lactamase class C family)